VHRRKAVKAFGAKKALHDFFVEIKYLDYFSFLSLRNRQNKSARMFNCSLQNTETFFYEHSLKFPFYVYACLKNYHSAPAGNHQLVAEDLMEDGAISRISNAY
jgi:hypothetical protein